MCATIALAFLFFASGVSFAQTSPPPPPQELPPPPPENSTGTEPPPPPSENPPTGGNTQQNTTLVFSAEPSTVAYGESTLLRWTATFASSCSASGNWSGGKGVNNQESTGALFSSANYTLACSGTVAGVPGIVTRNVSITVGTAPTNPPTTPPPTGTIPTQPSPPTQPAFPVTQTPTGSTDQSGMSQSGSTVALFTIGGPVSATAFLNVRSEPNGAFVVIEKAGSRGRVINGPVEAGGYRWWNVTWMDGTTGWSAGNWLSGGASSQSGAGTAQLPRSSGTAPPQTGTLPGSSSLPSQPTLPRQPSLPSQPNLPGTTFTPPQVPSRFSQANAVSDRVRTTSPLNVRTTPGGTLLGRAPSGAQGIVTEGPVSSGGHTWWKVDYENVQDGWSAGRWLAKDTGFSVVAFAVAGRVQAVEALKVRVAAGGALLGIAKSGAGGVIVEGPVSSGGYTWWKIDYDGGPDGWSAENWLSTGSSATPPPLVIGDRVVATSALNIRETPNGDIISRAAIGAQGKIVDGPVEQSGYHWWKIDYDTGSDGWSADRWLRKQ